jgi:hypothetical protein
VANGRAPVWNTQRLQKRAPSQPPLCFSIQCLFSRLPPVTVAYRLERRYKEVAELGDDNDGGRERREGDGDGEVGGVRLAGARDYHRRKRERRRQTHFGILILSANGGLGGLSCTGRHYTPRKSVSTP